MDQINDQHSTSIRTHIDAVQRAGSDLMKRGLVGNDTYHDHKTWLRRLSRHDQSKWSAQEFPGYAKHFFGGGDAEVFAEAWLHHIHNNDHHWQHWLVIGNFEGAEVIVPNNVIRMPELAALEMVADWMGASETYSGTTDMSDWLVENSQRIILHTETAEYVNFVLGELGYATPYEWNVK